MQLQANRILHGNDWRTQEFDAFFFAMSLGCLLQEVERAERELQGVEGDVQAAMADFHSRVPHARTIRNSIAHMDSWARGEGWEQDDRPWRPVVYRRPGFYALTIADMSLDVEAAARAAGDLRWRVVVAWSDHDAAQERG